MKIYLKNKNLELKMTKFCLLMIVKDEENIIERKYKWGYKVRLMDLKFFSKIDIT